MKRDISALKERIKRVTGVEFADEVVGRNTGLSELSDRNLIITMMNRELITYQEARTAMQDIRKGKQKVLINKLMNRDKRLVLIVLVTTLASSGYVLAEQWKYFPKKVFFRVLGVSIAATIIREICFNAARVYSKYEKGNKK